MCIDDPCIAIIPSFNIRQIFKINFWACFVLNKKRLKRLLVYLRDKIRMIKHKTDAFQMIVFVNVLFQVIFYLCLSF